MSEYKTICNNVPRDVLEGYDLTADERARFDYIDWHAVENGEASATFFRYKGELYDLNDCEGHWGNALPDDSPLRGWDGWYGETYFSAVVFRYTPGNDYDQVVVGRIYS